jgi:endoglucanase
MKKVLLGLLFIQALIIPYTALTAGKINQNHPGAASGGGSRLSGIQDSIPPDQTGMRDLTSVELAEEMVPGWNVGNSLEAIGGETAWGNPKITQELIDAVNAAGFKAVRIPVAWSNNMDTSTFAIDPALMARVEEVVNYVLNDDMYAIINIHWDGGWMNHPTYARQAYINNRLAAIWNQIALHFRDYDDHLLFAGTNEVMQEGNYGTPTKEYYTVQNSFNQTFVTTVRSTGGRNAYRHLAVQGFNTNINHTVNYFVTPVDPTPSRLMVEVHYYDPYDFTINQNSSITQWGKNATNPAKTETWANESYADGQFQKMKTKFIDNGFGVILGEYGVISRLDLGSDELNAEFAGYRKYYMEYITWSLAKHGLVPFYWDNGGTGNHGLGIFNRSDGTQAYPEIIKTIIDAADTAITTDMGDLNPNSVPQNFSLMQNYPNPFNPSTTIPFKISKKAFVSLKIYDLLGNEVGTLIDKELSPGIYHFPFSIFHFPLTSGVYFYRLQTPYTTETKKLILLK